MSLYGRLRLRTLFLLGLFASLLLSAPADTLTLQITPGRAAHQFGLMEQGSFTQWLGAGRFVDLMTPGTLGGWLELVVSIDAEEPFQLYDMTTGETLPAVGSTQDVRQGAWSASGTSSVYFMIPWELRDRQFALSQLEYGTTYIANKSTWSFTPYIDINWGEQFEAWSLYDPTKPFRLVDITNSMQAPIGLTNLINAQWEPADPPLVNVTFYVDAGNVGQTFTVHSRTISGAEHVQN